MKIQIKSLKFLLFFLLAFSLFIISTFLVVYILVYQWYQKPLSTVVSYHTAKNALWMKHAWVGEIHTDQEYMLLAQNLKKYSVSDAFFHVGPLDADGTISKNKYRYAPQLLESMHKYYPELRVQAWVGQVEKAWGGPLDLKNEKVVAQIVSTSSLLLHDGFDGIHYNIEPIADGSREFVEILKRTHLETKAMGKVLSVATDDLEPFFGAEKLLAYISKNVTFWSPTYYVEVASHVDQIAMMSYDTGLSKDFLFAAYIYLQTKNLISLVPASTTVFMGVPTYEDKRENFYPTAENVYSALFGIRNALDDLAKDKKLAREIGIGVYAEWTTDEQEWEFVKKKWIGK